MIEQNKSFRRLQKDLIFAVTGPTVHRQLLDNNLFARRPRNVSLLTKKQTKTCLKFYQDQINWPKEKWKDILWTNESKIVLFDDTASTFYVRHLSNTEYKAQYKQKTVKHGGNKTNDMLRILI